MKVHLLRYGEKTGTAANCKATCVKLGEQLVKIGSLLQRLDTEVVDKRIFRSPSDEDSILFLFHLSAGSGETERAAFPVTLLLDRPASSGDLGEIEKEIPEDGIIETGGER